MSFVSMLQSRKKISIGICFPYFSSIISVKKAKHRIISSLKLLLTHKNETVVYTLLKVSGHQKLYKIYLGGKNYVYIFAVTEKTYFFSDTERNRYGAFSSFVVRNLRKSP